jgi:hypothetical protein
MKYLKYLTLCCFLFSGIHLQAQDGPKADPADVESVDAIIAALYDVISGPAGEKRDWDRFLSLFIDQATLTAVGLDQEGKTRMTPMTPDSYVQRAGKNLEAAGFFEEEVGRTSDTYGHITQAFSTYISKRTADGEVYQRGINSIQVMYDGSRYWIVNVLWFSENDQFPIPKKYLKMKKK